MSHYKPYPAYRDSGVEWIGQVPSKWEVKPIKIVATFNDDVLPDSTAADTPISYVDISSVSYAAGIGSTEEMLFGNAPSRARRKAKVGDVVISTVRTYLKAVAAVDAAHADCVYSTGFAVLRSRTGHIEPNFLKWLALNELFIQSVESHSEGLSYPAINAPELVNLKTVMPSLPEQATIAVTIDRETARFDALIAKKTRFIELLKEKRQALITHAVTKGLDPNVAMKDSGVEWIGEVPEQWVIGRLCDFCSSISTGPFGTALGVSDYIKDGIPVINPSHMNDGLCAPDRLVTVSEETAQRLAFWVLREGDIVAARRGELGRAAIVTGEEAGWICGTGSLRLTPLPDRATPEYLYSVLQSGYARAWLDRESVGSTMPNLNESLIGRLPVVIPPSTTEQISLLGSLDQQECRVSSLIAKTQRSIDLLKERRSAFITAAVTGQIDLRESA
ncbi:type I restriction-modification protein subunit S [Aeromonas veronii]|uniref:Type I restriction-modification protein subunit S n=1 Tax=Aeromonas veronii TaxID=654 RepID=A0A6S5CGT5_AERVE|nr:restriction endonuclease subunit S [Aeromonas veronii]BBR39161.1 type I restriction-modification protein subunit S [Aeromonas veronii]